MFEWMAGIIIELIILAAIATWAVRGHLLKFLGIRST